MKETGRIKKGGGLCHSRITSALRLFIGIAISLGWLRPGFTLPRCGIFLSSWVAGSNRIDQFIQKARGTPINAFVIHIKDEWGNIYIPLQDTLAATAGLEKVAIADLKKLVAKAKTNDIYLIGKIDCFKSKKLALNRPQLAVRSKKDNTIWRDVKGLAWVDPYCETVWELNITVAKTVAQAGFDEVQFDYVRFPDGGDLNDCFFPHRPEGKDYSWAIETFLRRAVDSLAQYPVKVSADFFGIVPWEDRSYLLGQHLERSGQIVDYIYPMIYPSHFPDFWYQKEGVSYSEPEKVVSGSCLRGNRQLEGKKAALRPWLQGFDYKVRNFSYQYIVTQIKAAEEAGCREWYIWNAKGEYGETWKALAHLKKEADRAPDHQERQPPSH